jgi:hypothetical protein
MSTYENVHYTEQIIRLQKMIDYEIALIADCFLNYNSDEIMFRVISPCFNQESTQLLNLYNPYNDYDVDIIDSKNTEYIQKIMNIYMSVFENIDVVYLEAQ